MLRPVAFALALSSASTVTSAAFARAASDVPYNLRETFSAAMRFVRVDKGCEVTDKDATAAFVIFQCRDEDKVKRGAVEIFHARADGKEGVRLQIALGDDPHYMEVRWLELLERKLRDERGTPPPVKPAPPEKPPADGGASP